MDSVELKQPKSLNTTPVQVAKIVDEIKRILGEDRVMTLGNIVRITAACMVVAGQMKISNSDKKNLVLDGLKKYIAESALKDEAKEILKLLAENLVDDAINVMADINKKVIVFARAASKCC